jgi:hypothetical protein
MKKLALTLDDLRVETFSTGGGKAKEGTVRAHCGVWTDPNYCPVSGKGCQESVDYTCEFTGPGADMTCCLAAC